MAHGSSSHAYAQAHAHTGTHRHTRTAHHATGGHRHTPRTARVRRYCKLSERREGAVTPNAS
nr:MAG TPA: hypothetical protein [Caudoviricetes sp.]